MNRALSVLRDVWLVWLALAVLTTAPYLLAWGHAPAGHSFGGVLTAYDDTFTYLAWSKQASNGRLLMCDLFTSEQQRCEFLLPLWNCLGAVARLTGASLVAVFHAARLLSALVLLIAARGVARLVIKSRRRVRFVLWTYSMSGGLGWLVFLLRNRTDLFAASITSGSIDLNLPEAIAFRSAFAQVHFTIGGALVGAAILMLFNAIVKKRIAAAALAGATVSALAVVHPYLVVLVLGVSLASLVFSLTVTAEGSLKNRLIAVLRIAVCFGGCALPGLAYLFYLSRSNAVLREWLRITDTTSPPPVEYVLGFGVVGALGIAGLALLWRRGAYARLFVVWIVIQSLLLYAPVNFQRRLIEGLQLPLVVSATLVLFWLIRRFRRRAAGRLIPVLVLILASLTNIGFLIGQLAAKGYGADDPRRYIPSNLTSALEWTARDAEPDSVIFCSYFTGNIAPSIAGLRVYLGHYGLTMNSGEKGEAVSAFYRGEMPDQDALRLFSEQRVKYVIFGPFERAVSQTFEPPRWLTRRHAEGDVQIFKVDVAAAMSEVSDLR